MKVIVILDQIQSGLGGKEHADTPLGGKKIAMGSAATIEKDLAQSDSTIIGTFYCGTQYYQNNQALVQQKFAKMAEKMKADVVVLGPAYDYHDFAQMACEIGDYIQQNTSLPVLTMLAQEKNADLLAKYRQRLLIVKMPPKGGSGLAAAIDHLVAGCLQVVQKEDLTTFKSNYCY